MDGPGGYHTEQSQSERKRQVPHNTTYVWNLKDDANEHMTQMNETETDSQTEDKIVAAEPKWEEYSSSGNW